VSSHFLRERQINEAVILKHKVKRADWAVIDGSVYNEPLSNWRFAYGSKCIGRNPAWGREKEYDGTLSKDFGMIGGRV